MCCKTGAFALPTIIYSLAIAPSIIAVCGIAHGLRKLAETHVDNEFHRVLCMEAIASFELCANASELSIVADTYDLLSYTFYLFATSIWYSYTWENATACPYIPLEDVVEGNCDYKEAAQKVAAQLAGGFAGLYYINYLYSLELLGVHSCRSWARCSSYIRIPFIMALLIEAMFTCAYRVLTKYINNGDYKNSSLVSCLAGIMLVLLGRELSLKAFCYPGGNLNPVLSTVSKYHCCGTSAFKHVTVYWVGPCLGSVASLYAYPFLFK